jgi:hypothetical protein
MRGGGCGGARATPPRRSAALALDRRQCCTLAGLGARGRANALISVIETGSGSGCHTPPTASSLGRPWSARSRACPTPILLGPRQPPARPPPATAAAALDGHDQGRPGSPSRCRCWAARLAAASTSCRPRRSLRCWPGLPPTLPPPRQDRPLPSGRARRRRPGRGRRHRTRWVLPAPARRGRAGAGARRPLSRTLYAPPAGRAAWRSNSPPAVRVQAVGLVGAGQPVGEVARALGVHPAALRRWIWQAWRRWGPLWA